MEGSEEILDRIVMEDGEFGAGYEYRQWRGAILPIVMKCHCGGQSNTLNLPCPLPGETAEIVGKCLDCKKELKASIVVFI